MDIVKEYGYPVVSKEQSGYIEEYRNTKNKNLKLKRLIGVNGSWKISEKWKFLIESDFKISNKCCYYLKKEPVKRFEKESGRHPIIGMMANESSKRKCGYLKTGCNSFVSSRPQSNPLGFWNEEDIWEYIKINNLEISEEYTKNGRCRTGCSFCLYSAHIEQRKFGTNNILRLERDYPKLYKFCMEKLNYKHVMKTLGLPWYNKEQKKLFEEE